MSKIYLYLAGRDKKGIKVLATLSGPPLAATRINNPADLGLSASQVAEVNSAVYGNRMDWELWAESAENARQLEEQIRGRGFQNVAATRPMLSFGRSLVAADHRFPD